MPRKGAVSLTTLCLMLCLLFATRTELCAEATTVSLIHVSGLGRNLEAAAKVQPLFEKIQREEGKALLLNVGETLSPGESAYLGPGRSMTLSLLEKIGAGAWVPGGSDFARSADEFSNFLRDATFPVLGANLHRPDGTGRHLSQVQPFTIVPMGRLRIALLGLSSGGRRVQVANPVEAARYYVPLLREASDAVVLVTHLDFGVDSTLAEEVDGIDVIIGTEPTSGSVTINGVLLAYASIMEGMIGRIDLKIEDGKILSKNFKTLSLNSVEGPGISAVLAGWKAEVDGKMIPAAAVLGTSAGGFGSSLGRSSAMGHLIADLMRISVGSDLAFVAASNVDPELPEGPIRTLDLLRVYGWSNQVVIASIKGVQVRRFLEGRLETPGGYFYPSGLQVRYDLSATGVAKIVSITIGDQPLDDKKSYRAAVEDRIATGEGAGKGLAGFLEAGGRAETGVMIRDLIVRHIQTLSHIKGQVDDRVQEN